MTATPVVRIFPVTVAIVIAVTFVAIWVLQSQLSLTIYTALLILILIGSQRGSGNLMAGRLLKWTIPFVVPLIVIHGLLNATFPISIWLWDAVPLRFDGLRFGYIMSVRVVLLSTVAGFLVSILRDDFVESLIRLRLPSWIVLFLMQSTAMAGVIQRRVSSVYLAQRSRGIPVGSGFLSRVRSVPSMLLPVVIGTFLEAEGRVPALVSQGFGIVKPRPLPRPKIRKSEWLFCGLPVLAFVIAIVADHVI